MTVVAELLFWIIGVMTRVEYYEDYFEATGTSKPTVRGRSAEAFEVKEKILDYFTEDVGKIIKVFTYFEMEANNLGELGKADYLKTAMLSAFPDLLTNPKRLNHVLSLMDALQMTGCVLLPRLNWLYMKWGSYEELECNTDVNDMFRVWVSKDPESLVWYLMTKGHKEWCNSV